MTNLKPLNKSDPIYEDYESILRQDESIYNVFELEYYNPHAFKVFLLGLLSMVVANIYFIFLSFLFFLSFLSTLIILFIIIIISIISIPSVYFMIHGHSLYILAKRTQKSPYRYVLTNERLFFEKFNDIVIIRLEDILSILQYYNRSNTYSISIRMKESPERKHIPRGASFLYTIPYIPNSNNFYENLYSLASINSEIDTQVKEFNLYRSILLFLFMELILIVGLLIPAMVRFLSY